MKTSSSLRSRVGFKGGTIALALAALTLAACNAPGNDTTSAPQPQASPTTEAVESEVNSADDVNVQVGELTGSVEDYLGQTVSIRGDMVEAIGENAFVLRDDQLFGGNEVIVFNTSGNPLTMPVGSDTERFQVTGQVQQLALDDIAQQHGLTLDEETYGEYADTPVILAESIVLAPEPNEISDNPEAFYNQLIAVEGEVGEQYDPATFTVSQEQLLGGADVLVVGENPVEMTLENAEAVVIVGTLRPYVATEFEQEFNLGWDEELQQTIATDYNEEPVIVAEQVYPINR